MMSGLVNSLWVNPISRHLEKALTDIVIDCR
jgi:hypothetical protein